MPPPQIYKAQKLTEDALSGDLLARYTTAQYAGMLFSTDPRTGLPPPQDAAPSAQLAPVRAPGRLKRAVMPPLFKDPSVKSVREAYNEFYGSDGVLVKMEEFLVQKYILGKNRKSLSRNRVLPETVDAMKEEQNMDLDTAIGLMEAFRRQLFKAAGMTAKIGVKKKPMKRVKKPTLTIPTLRDALALLRAEGEWSRAAMGSRNKLTRQVAEGVLRQDKFSAIASGLGHTRRKW